MYEYMNKIKLVLFFYGFIYIVKLLKIFRLHKASCIAIVFFCRFMITFHIIESFYLPSVESCWPILLFGI